MKREVNMRPANQENSEQKLKTNESTRKERIITDPFGSWTGVCDDDKFESPIQDADDL